MTPTRSPLKPLRIEQENKIYAPTKETILDYPIVYSNQKHIFWTTKLQRHSKLLTEKK